MIRHEAQPCGKKSSDLGSDNQHDKPGLAQTLAFEPERLRLARELKELSQAELAARLDVTPAAVSRFETGVTRPGMDALDRMTSALGVPAQFFSLPVTETYDGFFRLLRRTSVSHQRRARALAHIAHDLAVTARASGLPPVRVPQIPVTGLQAPRRGTRGSSPASAASVRHAQRPSTERRRGPRKARHPAHPPPAGHRRRRRLLAALP